MASPPYAAASPVLAGSPARKPSSADPARLTVTVPYGKPTGCGSDRAVSQVAERSAHHGPNGGDQGGHWPAAGPWAGPGRTAQMAPARVAGCGG